MKVARLAHALSFCLLAGLGITSPSEAKDPAFSMQVMDSFRITGRGTVLTGKIASGTLTVGDTVCVPMKSGEVLTRTVDGIESFRKLLDKAEAGKNVGILVANVESKEVAVKAMLNGDCE